MSARRFSLHCLIPPYILDALSKSEDPAVRKQAVDAIEASATARAVRTTLSTMPQMAAIPSPAREKHRLIYNLQGRTSPPCQANWSEARESRGRRTRKMDTVASGRRVQKESTAPRRWNAT